MDLGGGCTLPLDPSLHILYFVKDIPRTSIVMISATIRHSRSGSQKTYVFIYAILFVISGASPPKKNPGSHAPDMCYYM